MRKFIPPPTVVTEFNQAWRDWISAFYHTLKSFNFDSFVQTLTVSGAISIQKQSVELNHASVVIAATIANTLNHQGLFIVKDISASGTAAHTLTLTSGTFDGTNAVATLNAPGEALVVYFDSVGNGVIVENINGVVLS